MQLESGKTIISGIEPVDELMGGLDQGQLYLVHGESVGKSLFGIKFLIEGLKQGENAALVIRYSPEDAVRRFAHLGYDCLEDVYSGRLVILEYSDDIIQKIGKLRELTPVLRELEWLLGETRPVRLIFDPLSSVLAGAEGNLDAHAREFAEWARSFGATVILVANESDHDIINGFEPLVAESFRFDLREVGDRAARFIAFEKSLVIPDQAIEVDPTRGVFLLGRVYAEEPFEHQLAPHPPSIAELELIKEELRAARYRTHTQDRDPFPEIDLTAEAWSPIEVRPESQNTAPLISDEESRDTLETRKLTSIEEREFQSPRVRHTTQPAPSISTEELELDESVELLPDPAASVEGQMDELSYLLDDLSGSASPLDLDLPGLTFAGTADTPALDLPGSDEIKSEQLTAGSTQPLAADDLLDTPSGEAGQSKPRSTRHGRASDIRIDSAMAARAVEMLLHPPDSDVSDDSKFGLPEGQTVSRRAIHKTVLTEPDKESDIRPGDFNVLIIEDEPETCASLAQTLGEYTVEIVHDGVSGLAKLISFKPDLVVLDFDLPVIDGFKILTLIRSALNVPIIILSGSRMRAIDRVMASELGADYYLTKPFNTKELKHKARQLIARYRGLSSWIINPVNASSGIHASANYERPAATPEPERELFMPYSEFAAEVDKRVKEAMDDGAPISIVGCRLPQMTAEGGRQALKLFDMVHALTRESDLTSTNQCNDLVILLMDAGSSGARSFAGRLRARIVNELKQEPGLWMRSFPDPEEATEAAVLAASAQGATLSRRSGDQANQSVE